MTTRGANFIDKWMAEHLPNGLPTIPRPSST
ncbi:hypothetical protein CK220_30900 [Mesorhizobium sp. WSM3860]|nr:hypothetical protein CK220_30900 [Mesorhizobium sp. WSM3860]